MNVEIGLLSALMEHGRTGWEYYKCRCGACHKGLRDRAKLCWALRQVRAGRDPATRVMAGQTRRRIAMLEAEGWRRYQIARRAGVANSTISRICDPSTEKISRIVAMNIQAIPLWDRINQAKAR